MDLGQRAAERVQDLFDFRVEGNFPQRKLVSLGKAISRAIGIDMVLRLADRGFNRNLVATTTAVLRRSVALHLTGFQTDLETPKVGNYREASAWRGFLAGGA